MSITHLLFDLDGTLVDPIVGIVSSYEKALTALGISLPPPGELAASIGPALRTVLSRYLGPERQSELEDAVRLYRRFYVDEGAMLKDPLYDGIVDVLQTAHDRGYTLYIATAKAASYAHTIVAHHGLLRYFKHVYGSELDGTRSAKADLLAHLLREESLQSDTCLMIGDTAHDAGAARANRIAMLGVTYGYGTVKDLTDIGVHGLCAAPGEILAAIEQIAQMPTAERTKIWDNAKNRDKNK